ncbi:hypothetical protein M885DRAFT_505179 [Pelagophyceae sp. CCMP2097]|nr:hypothetical protein M885DRAFT_505179 [Pelagophyceae sp. CCMP2097]
MGKKTALSWGWAVFIIKWVFSLGACFAGCLLLHRFSRQPPKGSTEALARLPTDELLKALDDPETRANALRCLLDRSSTERRADLETADCLRALLEAFRETKTGPVRSLALSVLARVARSAEVRAAVLANPKLLASVVQPLDDVLEAEKSADDDDDDESEPTPAKMAAEEATAELLRKAFVCLGALADGDAAMQSVCADAGAVATILDAMEWFALHRALQQWALWALFTLSFEHSQNKLAIVKAGGLERTMREMKAHPREIEIQRHAVLLLFSCLRADASLDAFSIRTAALNAGMRGAVSDAVEAFGGDEMISQMGKEILQVIDEERS